MLPITPVLPYLQADFAMVGSTQTFALSQSPQQGGLFLFFYNGQLQIPGLHYLLSQRNVELFFRTSAGDNCYAIYQAVTLN